MPQLWGLRSGNTQRARTVPPYEKPARVQNSGVTGLPRNQDRDFVWPLSLTALALAFLCPLLPRRPLSAFFGCACGFLPAGVRVYSTFRLIEQRAISRGARALGLCRHGPVRRHTRDRITKAADDFAPDRPRDHSAADTPSADGGVSGAQRRHKLTFADHLYANALAQWNYTGDGFQDAPGRRIKVSL